MVGSRNFAARLAEREGFRLAGCASPSPGSLFARRHPMTWLDLAECHNPPVSTPLRCMDNVIDLRHRLRWRDSALHPRSELLAFHSAGVALPARSRADNDGRDSIA